METQLTERYHKATEQDHICDNCAYPMKLIKGPKRKKYGKINDYYHCDNCGNRFRKRTQNEILRDLGERE